MDIDDVLSTIAAGYASFGEDEKALEVVNIIKGQEVKITALDEITKVYSGVYIKNKQFNKAIEKFNTLMSSYQKMMRFYYLAIPILEAGEHDKVVDVLFKALGFLKQWSKEEGGDVEQRIRKKYLLQLIIV